MFTDDRQPGEWGHWTGGGLTWNGRCAACHDASDVTGPWWIDVERPEESLFLAAPLAKAAGGNRVDPAPARPEAPAPADIG